MASEDDQLSVRVIARRSGTVSELTAFLRDFEAAYNRLYLVEHSWSAGWRGRRPFQLGMFWESEYWRLNQPIDKHETELIVPDDVLMVTRVSIGSPGFWEFLGSLNPLQQIREFLNDRHKRRQDHEYRELAEKEKLVLDNELIQSQILEKQNSILRERVEIMRDAGFSEKQIREFVWSSVGKPLSQLGRHQDARLIEGISGDNLKRR
jgi:hypothetical protein